MPHIRSHRAPCSCFQNVANKRKNLC